MRSGAPRPVWSSERDRNTQDGCEPGAGGVLNEKRWIKEGERMGAEERMAGRTGGKRR